MISVIIPIYNTEKYLSQCVNSILSQSYKDLEIILVNDASTDGSLYICQSVSNHNKFIKIINKSLNEGVDKARFSGLAIAKGKYVTFIDADDWLENSEILSIMYQKAEETGADYVEMGMQRVMDRHKWIKKTGINPITGFIQQPELFEKYYMSFFGYNIISINMAGKLYRKSTIDKANIKPSGICMGEDLLFNLKLFPYLKSIYILDTIGYNYRFGGMTSKYNKHLYPDLKYLYKLKEDLIDKYQYFKARDYIRIEMKNVLRSDICQQIIFKTGSVQEIKEKLSKELEDPIWNQVMQIKEHPQYNDDPFLKAIASKDVTTIYNSCLSEVKQNRLKRNLKKIASFVFTHI